MMFLPFDSEIEHHYEDVSRFIVESQIHTGARKSYDIACVF